MVRCPLGESPRDSSQRGWDGGRSMVTASQDSFPSSLSQSVQSGLTVLFTINPYTVRDQFILLYTHTHLF